MSSRNDRAGRPLSRRQVLTLAGVALVGAALAAACQPLYGPTASGAHLKEVMAGVDVATIPGRVGQRLRNELIFATTRGGYPVAPKYQLVIVVRESLTNLLVVQSGEAQGQIFQLDADFRLIELASNKVVLKGKSTARAALDRFEQSFANVRARIDAENRAAAVAAEGIRTRIAAFLSKTA